jgi:uncharacterized protein YciI
MPKYFMTWEAELSKYPTDPKERMAYQTKHIEMVKQLQKEGLISDWGIFLGESRGYMISEKSWTDVAKMTLSDYPDIQFKTHQALSINEYDSVGKSMMK